ncbi:MAG: class I SAM-dependent methyltransferase [Dehalococcoidia bacterium]|nr:class I SAM-dependent methyltransferase [Dehalococcoidia bacterium]
MTSGPYESDDLAELYDFVWGEPDDDARLYEQFARRGETPSLELGVGSGRIALSLARAKLDVVGLDASRPMLRRLEAALDASLRRRLRLVEADMRDFSLGERFDLVYCAANTFQHLLTTDDQIACLRCVAAHLAPGGLYVMQLRAPRAIDWGIERTPLELRWTRALPDGHDLLQRFDSTVVSAARQTATTTHLFDRVSADGGVSRRIVAYTLRYAPLSELTLLIEGAGMRVTAVYGDAQLSPYSDESDTIIVVSELEGA